MNAHIVGFWYSHCGLHESLMKHSLTRLVLAKNHAAQHGIAVDIVCSVWRPLSYCPFPQVVWPNHQGSNLNMLGQMKTLVAWVETSRAKFPQLVSMLEHDVLYPDSYFVDVFNNLDAQYDIFCNMNYIGMKETGYQALVQLDRPMHQMSLRFAILPEHINSRIAHSHANIAHNVEPDTSAPHKVFETKWPAIHVNTMHYHTSHFNVYSADGTEGHLYWGDHRSWYPPDAKSPR